MDVTRRGLLFGALGVVGLGASCVAAAHVMTSGAPDDPAPTGSGSASASGSPGPTPSMSPTPEAEDLDLHVWDTVRRPQANAGDAGIELVRGTLPAGLAIAGSALVGRPTATGPYAFEIEVRRGTRRRRRSFAGTVGDIKRDLSVSLSLDEPTPLRVTARELDRIARLGANATLVVLCYIDDPTSTTFTRVSDDRIEAVFAMAKERGVRITLLKPHIVTAKDGDGFYRANYAPASVDAFFSNWQAQLEHFAQLCADNDVEYLSVSCEQPAQTTAEQYERWVPLLTAVRAVHPGIKLTAAFTTLELFLLYTYWVPQKTPHMAGLLDVLGINSWIRLTDKIYTPEAPNITVDELVAGWRGAGGTTDDHLGKLESVCSQLRIPFLITEVGVQPRVDGLLRQEGSTQPTGAHDNEVQALLFESVLRAPLRSPWCTGASIWHVREPFAFGNVRKDPLTAAERVLQDRIERVPALASKTF